MCVKGKSCFSLIVICTLLCSIMSCKKKEIGYTRIDLSDAVEYIEAPPDYFVGDMIRLENDFKPLEKKGMPNLLDLLEDENNYLWLRIRFQVPRELQNSDVGLYIGYIHAADRVWLNNSSIRTYGNFPPNALGAGYQAQYFMFARNMVKQKEVNTMLIQVWTGTSVSISDNF